MLHTTQPKTGHPKTNTGTDYKYFVNLLQIHPVNERDPVPLAVHHYPDCSTFAFFNQVFHLQSKPSMSVFPYKYDDNIHKRI